MSNLGDRCSGLKVPAPGSVNVSESSPIMFLAYLDDYYPEDADVYQRCNIWIGGMHVVKNGDVTRGWELMERKVLDGDRLIIKIRYRGNLPAAQMFCYGDVAGTKFCNYFFVKGASTASGIMLKDGQLFNSSVGFDKNIKSSSVQMTLKKDSCAIVKGDIFWMGEFFCSMSKSLDVDEISGLKCHRHGDSIYFFGSRQIVLIQKNGSFRRIPMDRDYKYSVSNKRIDISYAMSSKTRHIYKHKQIEPLDRGGDIFECDIPESYSLMGEAKITKVLDNVKFTYDKNSLIIQRSFDPVRSDSDDILWTKKDIGGDKSMHSSKSIESVMFADCDKLLVKMTGGEKFLVGIYVPDVERI
jgi:hypothetical protein